MPPTAFAEMPREYHLTYVVDMLTYVVDMLTYAVNMLTYVVDMLTYVVNMLTYVVDMPASPGNDPLLRVTAESSTAQWPLRALCTCMAAPTSRRIQRRGVHRGSTRGP
eukprot:1194768-Prorocentrum_minimum.AAC.6